MKKYRHRLDPILRLREFEEKQAEGEFARQASEVERLNGVLGALQRQQAAIEQQMASASVFDPNRIMRALQALQVAHGAVVAQEQEVQAGTLRLAEKREAWLEAMKERKKLEKHRERGEAEHRAAADRQEAQQLDELATIRYARAMPRTRGGGW